jgi:hypothetical protein
VAVSKAVGGGWEAEEASPATALLASAGKPAGRWRPRVEEVEAVKGLKG